MVLREHDEGEAPVQPAALGVAVAVRQDAEGEDPTERVERGQDVVVQLDVLEPMPQVDRVQSLGQRVVGAPDRGERPPERLQPDGLEAGDPPPQLVRRAVADLDHRLDREGSRRQPGRQQEPLSRDGERVAHHLLEIPEGPVGVERDGGDSVHGASPSCETTRAMVAIAELASWPGCRAGGRDAGHR